MERFASFVTGNSEKCQMSPCTVVMLSVFDIAVLKYWQENLKVMNVVETSSIYFLLGWKKKTTMLSPNKGNAIELCKQCHTRNLHNITEENNCG